MKDVCETLFEPLRSGVLNIQGKKSLFLNAQINSLLNQQIILQQGFKPYAQELEQAGFKVLAEIPEGKFDVILHLFPKNIIEGQYQIAQGLELLAEGGVFVCAADNKSGGARLENIFTEFGFQDVQKISKNKARVVYGKLEGIQKSVVDRALAEGSVQGILDGAYLSQPGVFGWDKIDQGSELLVRVLPDDLKGRGADFGCGYGYLARHVLGHSSSVTHLVCLDADYRAVQLCCKNLENFEIKTSFLWCDLAKPLTDLKNLDFVVMNPPFHEGKSTDIETGKSFIKNAALSLRKGGSLWMVANAHLPYEAVFRQNFSEVSNKMSAKGFKAFHAVK